MKKNSTDAYTKGTKSKPKKKRASKGATSRSGNGKRTK